MTDRSVRTVADANIYVSAYHFRGSVARIVELAQEGWIELFVSESVLAEVERVLRRKFGWAEERLQKLRENILDYARLVRPTVTVQVVNEDPTDDRILECALAAGAEFVITGDRHLRRLGQYQGIQILTPGDFLRSRIWER